MAATAQVAQFLAEQGLDAHAYSSDTPTDERASLEERFRENRLKVLVATSALGMGVDKPDVAFVYHLGAPPSPIAYYQQVGRAGRSIDTAEAWLLPESSNEIGRVARTLAEAGRFADPYVLPTGPTAHPPPLWTGLRGLIYHLLGFGLAAGRCRAVLGIVCWSAVPAVIPWVGARVGLGRRAGLAGGLAGALLVPQQSEEIIGWTANEPLAAVALALPAAAQEKAGRYTMSPTDGGFLRHAVRQGRAGKGPDFEGPDPALGP